MRHGAPAPAACTSRSAATAPPVSAAWRRHEAATLSSQTRTAPTTSRFSTGSSSRFFRFRVSDVRCGMRSIRRDALARLRLGATGMEFASEFLVEAAREGLRSVEVPVSFRPRRSGGPRRSLGDGWRVARQLLLLSPTRRLRVRQDVMAPLGNPPLSHPCAAPSRGATRLQNRGATPPSSPRPGHAHPHAPHPAGPLTRHTGAP